LHRSEVVYVVVQAPYLAVRSSLAASYVKVVHAGKAAFLSSSMLPTGSYV